MSSDRKSLRRISALTVLFANVLGKATKPLLLAVSSDFEYPIILRMLYSITNGDVDWYSCFLLDVIQSFILSVTIYSVLKKRICTSKLILVILYFLLDSYFIVGNVIKLHINENLETIFRNAVEEDISKNAPANKQSLRNHHIMSYYLAVAIFIHFYMITMLVFKIFSAYVIFKFFKSESSRELDSKIQILPPPQLPARRAVYCEECNEIESVPPAPTPSAPPIDKVCTLRQMDPLIPSSTSTMV